MKKIDKILIANRGEIACRVIKTCQKIGISTAAVYSDIDCGSVFVRMADEAVNIGAHGLGTYLDQEKIIEAAKKVNACAIHPGYGLLSENPQFMSRCADAGIIFIGPSSDAITTMGSKIMARELCEKIGTPVVPGFSVKNETPEELASKADKIGFPVLIKASAGGGGIGIFIVENKNDFPDILSSARKKSMAIYGNDSLLIEKYLKSVRHIEFQVFGDQHGNVIHCGERECSVQRRHQKMIEEAPSPVMNETLRKKMGDAAVAIVHAVKYTNAGTVEFVLDDNENFYFLEMNTRLQVEHPVTEAVTGLDLVEIQIKIAEGEPLGIRQEDISITGHAIECRVYSEDPENNFIPSAGKILFWNEAPHTRIDSGVETSSEISINFDPMLAKVITHAENRHGAIRKMEYALKNSAALGIATNIDFIADFLKDETFINGNIKTDFFDNNISAVRKRKCSADEINAMLAAAVIIRIGDYKTEDYESVWPGKFHVAQHLSFQIDDIDYTTELVKKDKNDFQININDCHLEVIVRKKDSNRLTLTVNNWLLTFSFASEDDKIFLHSGITGHHVVKHLSRFHSMEFQHHKKESCEAPMDGIISSVKVQAGESVEKGQVLIIIESMKMESLIYSDKTGTVKEIFVKQGDFVKMGSILVEVVTETIS